MLTDNEGSGLRKLTDLKSAGAAVGTSVILARWQQGECCG